MADYNGPRKMRPKTALDDSKWKLYGEKPVDGQQRVPTLQFIQKTNGNPALECWLNNGAQGKDLSTKGKIVASLDPYAIEIVFDMVRRAARAKEVFKEHLDVLVSFKFGKPLDKPEVGQTIIVGRDESGMIYIGLREQGKPAVRFPFTCPKWFKLYTANGPLPPDESDRRWALAWTEGVSKIWSQLLASNWKEPERNNNNGNNNNRNSGGYNNNSGGGYSPPPNDFDEDLPDDKW